MPPEQQQRPADRTVVPVDDEREDEGEVERIIELSEGVGRWDEGVVEGAPRLADNERYRAEYEIPF